VVPNHGDLEELEESVDELAGHLHSMQ
jgi:hypothetical protein